MNEHLDQLERASLRDRVYRALRDAVVSGVLAPGVRLRDQELATRLGVSRTPVREALQRLEDEGLVVTSPRASTAVTPLDARAAREAFPVVAALHALATRSGVPRLTPADLAAMRAANAELAMHIASLDPDAVLQAIGADDRFHGVVLAAADNREIVGALDRLMPKVRRLEFAQFGSLAGRKSVRQHEAILAACERENADEAAALVEENWLSLGKLIAESLEQADLTPQPPSRHTGRGSRSGR
jgi:DNA-binding GntR family transcriptional regulator